MHLKRFIVFSHVAENFGHRSASVWCWVCGGRGAWLLSHVSRRNAHAFCPFFFLLLSIWSYKGKHINRNRLLEQFYFLSILRILLKKTVMKILICYTGIIVFRVTSCYCCHWVRGCPPTSPAQAKATQRLPSPPTGNLESLITWGMHVFRLLEEIRIPGKMHKDSKETWIQGRTFGYRLNFCVFARGKHKEIQVLYSETKVISLNHCTQMDF